MKQLDSAVCQLSKERAFSEVFGCVGGQASFFHRKWLADWQAALGISFVNHHLSLYSMRGERKRDYPANFFYPQPWWSEEKYISEYLGRVSAAVSTGTRLVQVLVLQPLRSAWCENSPSQNAFSGAQAAIDEPVKVLSQRLMEEKLDFHFGNETLISRHGRVERKKFVIGACAYDSVVVPPMKSVASETWELLRTFASQGGRVFFIHHLPSMIDAEPADLNFPEAQVFPGIEDCLVGLDRHYPARIRVKDVLTGENAKPVFVHSRALPEGALHFFANTSEDRGFKTRIALGTE
ncbi:MAG: glycoside hydrolase, partial [Spirochaetia bacterium]|nr:glycoside hydrolase [Spirochaetia bacterium]